MVVGFGALDAHGSDKQPLLVLLPGEDVFDAGADNPRATAAGRTAPAPPIPRRSNRLAKPVPHVRDAREWCQSTSLSLQNR
jgi:hypothetical protein